MTFSLRLRQHARYRPAKQAIVERGRSIDYRTLDRMVDHTAHALVAKGVMRGTLAGLSLSDRAEHLVVLLAMARIGAVILPLDPRWTAAETRDVAARFGTDMILSDSNPQWTLLRDEDFGESDVVYDDPSVGLDAPFLLSLSSGTTGTPKGPRLSQGKFIDRFTVYWLDLKLSAHDRFVTATPLYFGGGRGFALAMLWAGGTALLMCPPYRPDELVAFVNDQRGTAMFLVPTLLTRLAEAARGDAPLFPGLDVLIASGAALHPRDARTVRERLSPNLYHYYSSTEGGGCTLLTPDGFADRPGSVGQPCFGVEVELVDDDHQPLPPGRIGRLRYRSAASADHYYRGDDSAAFHDGFFYPGDLGEFDAEGFLTLRGRSKDVIIRGGVNIYPGDIEAALLDHPDIVEAAAVGIASPAFGEEIAVAAVTRGRLDADALAAHCAARLAAYKVPRAFLAFDEAPKTGGGKVDKRAIAAAIAARLAADAPALMAADPPAGYPPSREGHYVLAVLILAYIVSYIDRTMLTLLVDPIRATLRISDTQISLLHGFAFAIFYTLLGLPMGRIADRRSRRGLIVAGVLCWSVMTSLCGFARGFWQMFGARVGVGVGEATLSPAAYSLLSDCFPPERRSRALGIYTSGLYLGAGIATFGGGALIAVVPALTLPLLGRHEPWQVIFMAIGLLGVPVALMMLTVVEPRRQTGRDGDDASPLAAVLRHMADGRRVYVPLILGVSCYAMLTNGLKGWIPTFLMRTYHWKPADVGVAFGLVLLVFGTIGTAWGGYGAVWLRRRGHVDANMRLSVYAALAILPFGVAAPLMPSGGLAIAVYAIVIFLAGVPFGVSAAAIQQITPGRMRGQVSAVYLFWLNLAGIGTGPIIVALFTDHVFGSDDALRYSLASLAAVTAPLSALAFWCGLRPLRTTTNAY